MMSAPPWEDCQEIWVTENGVVLGELHARPGGDFIHALTEHSRSGLELYGTLIDDLLAEPVGALPEQTAAAGVEYLLLQPGWVRSIQGWESVTRDQAVIAAHLDVRPGDPVGPVRSYIDRHGVIAVAAGNGDEVEATLTRLMGTFRVDVEAARAPS